jgi:hypothetical protein
VPLRILQHRTVEQESVDEASPCEVYDGLTMAKATWENWWALQADYPSLNWEDNATYANANIHKNPKFVMLQGQMAENPNDPERRANRRPRE